MSFITLWKNIKECEKKLSVAGLDCERRVLRNMITTYKLQLRNLKRRS